MTHQFTQLERRTVCTLNQRRFAQPTRIKAVLFQIPAAYYPLPPNHFP